LFDVTNNSLPSEETATSTGTIDRHDFLAVFLEPHRPPETAVFSKHLKAVVALVGNVDVALTIDSEADRALELTVFFATHAEHCNLGPGLVEDHDLVIAAIDNIGSAVRADGDIAGHRQRITERPADTVR
jgi:hypothetical protein